MNIIDYLCTDKTYGYGINQKKLDKEQVLKLVTIRYAIGLNRYQKYIPVTVAEDVSDETVAAIMESIDDLPGVDIAEDSLRRYTDSKYFANIIGYTGQISQEEYDALSEKENVLADTVGQSWPGTDHGSQYLQGERRKRNYTLTVLVKVIGVNLCKESVQEMTCILPLMQICRKRLTICWSRSLPVSCLPKCRMFWIMTVPSVPMLQM